MVLVQKWTFFQFLFSKYRPGKCLLRYSKTKQRISRVKKQEVRKVEKIDILPKGLTDGFCPKMAIFPIFFFLRNISQENVFYVILERENLFLG